uniref:HD-GYP domain-containing protein n=1 Tax=Acetatifactor sp. TaxID=1872090 RepID=UPI004056327E
MQFVRTEDLKIGMRLARPIYSKKGVLLFERNSKLSALAIESVHNFGLLGIYILEPAEPLPPMTEEDLEFERFQTKCVFSIQDEISKILAGNRQNKISMIADLIIKNFGHLDNKINFYQNLRSRDDYVYRHSLNVAILCAMITHMMNLRRDEQFPTVVAAIIHDIGKIQLGGDLVYRDDLSENEQMELYDAQTEAAELIEDAFNPNGAGIRRICMQAVRNWVEGEQIPLNKLVIGARVLAVANRYDELTAMTLGGETKSEVAAIQELLDNPDIYEPQVVDALIRSVNILFPGVSIELNTGEKALVLVENPNNILRPVVLSFRDNSIVDLSLKFNNDIQIVDIMKTLDNRYIMDIEALKKAGYYA